MDVKQLIRTHLLGGLILLNFCLLTACATSDVSRDAEHRIDMAYADGANITRNLSDSHPMQGYKNASQIYQGAALGGLSGAITGASMTGMVGVVPGALGGAVFGGVLGAFVEQNSNQFDKIENRGGQVFLLGDQVMIVLPGEQIFRGISDRIQPRAYPLLNEVAKMISGYHSMMVKVAVSGYGNGQAEVELATTQDEANSIVNYLSYHADVRLISAVGLGGKHLVDVVGNEDNFRVEITLQNLPV